jgi:hypothetical protein
MVVSLYLSHANQELKLWDTSSLQIQLRVLRTIYAKKTSSKMSTVLYVDLGHAELVPDQYLGKHTEEVPIHAVYKEASTMTNIRAVFDTSAKTSSGNGMLAVGPTVHPQLLDVLFKLGLTRLCSPLTSKMYREIELVEPDKDYHRRLCGDKTKTN